MRFNMLKGMKRLILTTAALCGVGLFLCGVDVKATPTASVMINGGSITAGTDKRVKLTVKNDSTTEDLTVTDIKIYGNDKTSVEMLLNTKTTFTSDDKITITKKAQAGDPETEGDIYITNNELVPVSQRGNVKIETTGEVKITKIVISYALSGGGSDVITLTSGGGTMVDSAPLYAVTASIASSSDSTKPAIDGAAVSINGLTAGNTYYGFVEDSISLEIANIPAGISVGNYYQNIYKGSTIPDWNAATGWVSGTATISGDTYKVSSTTTENDYKIAYIPKIADISVKTVTNASAVGSYDDVSTVPAKIHAKNTGDEDITVTYELAPVSTNADDKASLEAKLTTLRILPAYTDPTHIVDTYTSNNINVNQLSASTATFGTTTFKLTAPSVKNNIFVNGGATTGNLTCTFQAFDTDTSKPLASGKPGVLESPTSKALATLYPCAELVTFDTVTLNIPKGGSKEVVITGTPAGADWAKLFAAANVDVSGSASGITIGSKTLDGNKVKVKFSVDASPASTTGTFYIKVTDLVAGASNYIKSNPTDYKLTVNVETIDSTKTLEAIKSQNYITVGYTLDVYALLKAGVTGSNGTKLGIAPDSISITSNSSYVTETKEGTPLTKYQLKGGTVGKVLLSATWGGTTINDIPIYVYPTPTAEFLTDSSNKNRIKVRIPYKVSTGYNADKNIKQGTGFYLTMLNSNGDTIFAYDKDKYQNVVNSSDSKYKMETNKINDEIYYYYIYVPAADVESMITTAASNGKFSNSSETASVVFRAAPMGKEAKSDNTIISNDEIANKAKTSGQTVYRIKASGANFSDSYAWGLDGQTINLTAYPSSGYRFTKWEDGNTSNPRQITVSSTGTKNFGVLGERTSGGGAGGAGANGDNSGLYDDVPKTAENNAAIWLIVFMVFAVIGTAYALYMQLKAATSKNGR